MLFYTFLHGSFLIVIQIIFCYLTVTLFLGVVYFSIVHLSQRLNDKKLVIIKQIPVEQMTKEERLAALNEVKVLSMLDHPNIIEYYENFLEDKALMIVMEYAPGRYACIFKPL